MKSQKMYKCRVCGNVSATQFVHDMNPMQCWFEYLKARDGDVLKADIGCCTVNPEDHIGIADLVGWKEK